MRTGLPEIGGASTLADGTGANDLVQWQDGGNIVSPVCWDGLLFSISHISILTCRDAESGGIHWTHRLGSRGLASLVAGDGKLYVLDQEGALQVFAANTTGSVLAPHSLRENCSATPAIAASMLFVRTAGHLYCIGSGE